MRPKRQTLGPWTCLPRLRDACVLKFPPMSRNASGAILALSCLSFMRKMKQLSISFQMLLTLEEDAQVVSINYKIYAH